MSEGGSMRIIISEIKQRNSEARERSYKDNVVLGETIRKQLRKFGIDCKIKVEE
jgi:hypothetical protein